MAESKQYDVVIIGAGPGGMTAAMCIPCKPICLDA